MTTVQTDKTSKGGQAAIAWLLAILTIGYMLPWAIAATRGKSNAGAIGWVNLLLGWTLIGWVVALIMAAGSHHTAATVQIVQAPTATPPGWYPAPDGQGQRYWNGTAWTDAQA